MADELEIIPPEAGHRPAAFVLEALATQPWAVTEEFYATMVSIANRQNDVSPEALEAYRATRAQNAELTTRRGPVAVITMVGPMFRYADFFTAISGGVTYESFARELTAQVADPGVRAILLNWDSPGGHANGVAEAAAMIAEAAKTKPIESYVGGQCCSAAYWMACASNKITVDRTAMLGSIGVRLGIRDSSERDAKSGVKNIEIISSRAPNKRTDFTSEEGRGRLIRMADQMEAVFIADVAGFRGVSEDDVVSNFGAGGVEIGADAVKAGMADALGSFEGVLARLSAGNGVSATQRRNRPMSNTPGATAAETAPVVTATAEQIEAAKNEGAVAAQARIGAILGSPEGKANPALANHFAFKTTMNETDAIAALAVQGSVTAPAAAPAAPAPAAQVPNGERTRDTAGGLALASIEEQNAPKGKQPEANQLSGKDIYAKRAATMTTSREG